MFCANDKGRVGSVKYYTSVGFVVFEINELIMNVKLFSAVRLEQDRFQQFSKVIHVGLSFLYTSSFSNVSLIHINNKIVLKM